MYQNVKTRTGNRVVVLLDGVNVGAVQSVRASDDYGPEAVSGIGDIHALEYTPSMARHSVSVSQMVLYAASMRQAGVAVENGDGALKGLVFDLLVLDKDTGAQLRKYRGCSYASGDIEITKHAILMASAQFNALDVQGTTI